MGDRSSASFANHAAGEDPMGGDFTGVIRSQDVRATEKDKIRMGDCFRPGDIVRATVVSEAYMYCQLVTYSPIYFSDADYYYKSRWCMQISLGDARSYFLSTASNNLGVVYALPSPSPSSIDGNRGNETPMVPINWQEMQCPRTNTIERRKVAKPE
jgi:exosome complex component CSL4